MSNDSVNTAFKTWYDLIKNKAPLAAVGASTVSIGIFVLILSNSLKDRVADVVFWIGTIISAIGILAIFFGFLLMAIKHAKK